MAGAGGAAGGRGGALLTSNELPRIPELSDYELVRELGRGASSVIYLARERELGRAVAIKLIRPGYVRDEDAMARLVREARTVGRLQHPGIVMLLGTRRLGDEGIALILQYVPGETLKDRIRRKGPFPFDETERVLRDVGRALAYAHTQRIVHRDVKPDNIYLDDDSHTVRLSDFGIARVWDSESGLTLPGTAIGTPAYMSPEQVDGMPLDGRSDLYSLGLVGYEMLTGRQPWAGESLYNVIYKQRHEELPPLDEVRQDVPENLRRAIEGAIYKDPDDRWPDIEAFLGALGKGSSLPHKPRAEPGVGPEAGPLPAPGFEQGFEQGFDQGVGPGGPGVGRGVEPAGGQSHGPGAGGDVGGRGLPGERIPDDDDLRAPEPLGPWAGPRAGAGFEPRAGSRREGDADPDVEPPAGSGSRPGFGDRIDPGPDPAGWFASSSPSELPFARPRGSGPRMPPPTRAERRRQERRKILTRVGAGVAAALLLLLLIPYGQSPSPADSFAAFSESMSDLVRDGRGDEGSEGSGSDSARTRSSMFGGTYGPDGESEDRRDDLPGVAGGESPEGFPEGWLDGVPEPGSGELPGGSEAADLDGLFAGEDRPVSVLLGGGDEQTGPPGAALPQPLLVFVSNADGVGVEGVPVVFEVVSGGGTATPARGVTGPAGAALTRWTLGARDEEQLLVARVEGVDGVEGMEAAFIATMDPEAEAGEAEELDLEEVERARAQAAAAEEVEPELTPPPAERTEPEEDPEEEPEEADPDAPEEGEEEPGGLFGTPTGAPLRLAIEPSVLAGGTYSCSLRADGSMACWGGNSSGELGDGSRSSRASPSLLVEGEPFARAAGGLAHLCALTPEGQAFCWGRGPGAAVGVDGSGTGDVPLPVPGPARFVELAAGVSHSCGLTAAGEALCWGNNEHGQLGDGTRQARSTPNAVQSEVGFRRITAGWRHTCALDADGAAYCWGDNTAGQLGSTWAGGSSSPRRVGGGHRFTQLAAGSAHTCGISTDGTTLCWGANDGGQLGDGTSEGWSSPRRVDTGERFVRLAAGGLHTCAVNDGGAAFCWGTNLHGQVGDGSGENRAAPVPVSGDHRFDQLHAFGAHTCGRNEAGDVLCWGYNVEGQLGDGTRENRREPVRVGG